MLDDNCIVFDETIAQNQLHDYLNISQPGAYFHNPASSGGWAPGAAFGAKLAAPDKDVIAVSGDGFYMFGTPIHALWAAAHYKAPFMAVVYQNRSYSTGTLRINSVYGKDSYAAKADYDGGYFDPPIDFAKEAEAAGAYGENVTDPAQIEPALRRGLERIRERPAGGDLGVARAAAAEGLNEEHAIVERNAMKCLRRFFCHLAAAAAVLGILSITPTLHEAQAQSGRTVRAIVPTPPAGVNDLMARLMADYLGKTHGLSLVVENRAGASEVAWHRSRGARRARRQHPVVRVDAGRHQPAAAEGELPSAGKLRAGLPDGGGTARLLGATLVALPHAQRSARRGAREARQRDDGKPRPRDAVRHRARDAQERDES